VYEWTIPAVIGGTSHGGGERSIRPCSVGSAIGRYPAKAIAWDFEVSDDDPVVTLSGTECH